MKKIYQTIATRIKSETPKFFVVIRNVSIALSGVCGAIVMQYNALPAGLTDLLSTGILKAIAYVSIGCAVVSQLTRTYPDNLKNETK